MPAPDASLSADSRKVAERTQRALIEIALRAYEDAGLSGLCAEGRWEAALGAIRDADVGQVVGVDGNAELRPTPSSHRRSGTMDEGT